MRERDITVKYVIKATVFSTEGNSLIQSHSLDVLGGIYSSGNLHSRVLLHCANNDYYDIYKGKHPIQGVFLTLILLLLVKNKKC